MKTVKISVNPTNGLVFTENANLGKDGKAYGWFMVKSSAVDFSGAIAQVKTRVAIKAISKEAYEAAKDQLFAGAELPGQIIAKEALSPFYDGQTPKTAGQDGEVCTLKGQPIYRITEFTSDMSLTDELIAHDNVITGSSVASQVDLGLAKGKK